MTQPGNQSPWRMAVATYKIATVTPAGFVETVTATPQAAAHRDPAQFLELYRKMTPIAQSLSQMSLPLGEPDVTS